jgi:hypothetical protein
VAVSGDDRLGFPCHIASLTLRSRHRPRTAVRGTRAGAGVNVEMAGAATLNSRG